MVFAQHEVAGGQLIHRVIEFDDLADCLVAGGDHHALGAIQHPQRILTAHRAEGMGDDILEIHVFQAIQDTGIGTIRIFLDIEDGTIVIHAGRRADHVVARFRRKHVLADRQIGGDRRFQHRHRLVDAIEDVAEQLQHFGKDDAVGGLVHAQAVWCIFLQHSLDVAGQLEHLGNGLILFGFQLDRIGGFFDQLFAGHHRPVDHGEVQLVLHQLLLGQRLEIAVGHVLVEGVPEAGFSTDATFAADVVHPEGHVGEIGRTQGLQ